MRTDVPAAVSPFDEAFREPPTGSHQDPDIACYETHDNKKVFYDRDNPLAWIQAEEPIPPGDIC